MKEKGYPRIVSVPHYRISYMGKMKELINVNGRGPYERLATKNMFKFNLALFLHSVYRATATQIFYVD